MFSLVPLELPWSSKDQSGTEQITWTRAWSTATTDQFPSEASEPTIRPKRTALSKSKGGVMARESMTRSCRLEGEEKQAEPRTSVPGQPTHAAHWGCPP
ncbi:hypothetical protein BSKO_04834 [Bryopsis sp. KO-2023]|nr:hypothetical protein BSKO_04834 [Bryopsis sp. KO-2023]